MSLLKEAEKEYYQNLDEKNIIDNKKFWKAVKPLLSDKSVSREKTIWLKMKTAATLNNLFSNIVKKLEILKFNSNNSITENSKDLVFKVSWNIKITLETFHFEEVNIGKSKKKFLS